MGDSAAVTDGDDRGRVWTALLADGVDGAVRPKKETVGLRRWRTALPVLWSVEMRLFCCVAWWRPALMETEGGRRCPRGEAFGADRGVSFGL